jgi:thiol-disulfide isomerase/thioredoxin
MVPEGVSRSGPRGAAARALALALGLTLVAGCSGRGSAEASTSAGGAADGLAPSREEVRTAPEFELQDLAGSTVRLSDSAGRVRLIDFWATWCAPCRDEIPLLAELDRTWREAGLTIIAISDEHPDVIRAFVEKHKIRYLNLSGSEELAEAYSVLGLPMAFLVDRQGRIVDTFFGPKPRKVLEGKLRQLLEAPPES